MRNEKPSTLSMPNEQTFFTHKTQFYAWLRKSLRINNMILESCFDEIPTNLLAASDLQPIKWENIDERDLHKSSFIIQSSNALHSNAIVNDSLKSSLFIIGHFSFELKNFCNGKFCSSISKKISMSGMRIFWCC